MSILVTTTTAAKKQTHTTNKKERIVSLLPSITEVLSALGVANQIVGITHECDYPPRALQGAQVVTVSDITPYNMTQDEIHEKVTGSLEQGHSLYGLHKQVLIDLQPDVIFTQSLCDVCAVSHSVVIDTCAKVFGGQGDDSQQGGPKIVCMEPNHLADVMLTFQVAGRALGLEEPNELSRWLQTCNASLK